MRDIENWTETIKRWGLRGMIQDSLKKCTYKFQRMKKEGDTD